MITSEHNNTLFLAVKVSVLKDRGKVKAIWLGWSRGTGSAAWLKYPPTLIQAVIHKLVFYTVHSKLCVCVIGALPRSSLSIDCLQFLLLAMLRMQ